MEWEHKDVWKKTADTFSVTIEHFTRVVSDGWELNDGGNRWCVYAYIYPTHPLFDQITKENMFHDALMDMPLHGRCSFIKFHYNEPDSISSKQIGCDYNHDGDSHYSFYKTDSDAVGVFHDAGNLIEFMKSFIERN